MNPSTGSVRTAPRTPESPISDASRKTEREYTGSGSSAGSTSSVAVRDPARLGRDDRHVAAHVARDVACPEEPEYDGQNRADRGHEPAENEPEQETGDSDREADRPEAGPGSVWGVGTVRAQR